jgi:membrane protein implicated in regulation of membrane protease activity
MSDIGYIKAGVDDMKREQKESNERHYALVERVTKVEESTKSAHHRIDELAVKKEG